MKPVTYTLQRLLIAVTCALAVVITIGNAQTNSGTHPSAQTLPPTSQQIVSNASSSSLDSVSRDQYCAGSGYLGHYYNYYYGNLDGREFFYYQRDWLALCGK